VPRLKTKRLRLYNQLREEHLTYREALEYSKMGKHKPPGSGKRAVAVYPPALRRIVQERRVMWLTFDRVAQDKGWGSWKRRQEWKGRVGKMYARLSRLDVGNPFVTKSVHGKPIPKRINPWALYDSVFRKLPAEDQWDTPRSHRKNPVTGVAFKVEKRYKEKQLRDDIRFYQQRIKETGDPLGEWKWKLDGARYLLRQGNY